MPSLEIKLIESIEEFSILKPKWDVLLLNSDSHSLFCSWDWLYHWWLIYANKCDQLSILTLFEGTEIKAIAPFYIKKYRFYSKLLFIGTGEKEKDEACSECVDILCIQSAQNNAINLINDWLTENQCRWDVIDLVNICAESVILHPLITSRYSCHTSKSMLWYRFPLIKLDDSNTTPKHIASIERKMEKLLRRHTVEFLFVDTVSSLEKALSELASLHQMRWQNKESNGVFSSPLFQSFHQAVSREFLKKQELAFYILRVDGAPRAALYNFRIRGAEYFYQAGLDTSFKKRFSLGSQLHLHAMKNARKSNLKYYDFMAGTKSSYKNLYECETSTLVDITFFGSSFTGRLLLLLLSLKIQIKPLKLKLFSHSN